MCRRPGSERFCDGDRSGALPAGDRASAEAWTRLAGRKGSSRRRSLAPGTPRAGPDPGAAPALPWRPDPGGSTTGEIALRPPCSPARAVVGGGGGGGMCCARGPGVGGGVQRHTAGRYFRVHRGFVVPATDVSGRRSVSRCPSGSGAQARGAGWRRVLSRRAPRRDTERSRSGTKGRPVCARRFPGWGPDGPPRKYRVIAADGRSLARRATRQAGPAGSIVSSSSRAGSRPLLVAYFPLAQMNLDSPSFV